MRSTILLIEGDARFSALVRAALTADGFDVDACHETESGLARALASDYGAIVLDFALRRPGFDDLLGRIREKRSTPVLVVASSASLGERVQCLDDGADDVLRKPFAMPELAARLRALIRRDPRGGVGTPEAGRVAIDARRLEIRIDDRKVDLTRGEFEILEPLVRSPGQAVPRAELEGRLSQAVSEGSNAVDVHIHNLRRKLGPERIRTRRGVGYVFEVEPR